MQFVLAHGERGSDAEDPAHAEQLHDVDVQTTFQTCRGDALAELIGRRLADFVRHQLDALQQPSATDVADLVVALT